jgi:hypothetical protein
MKLTRYIAATAGAVALGLFAVPAQAAPGGGPIDALNAAAAENGNVQQTHWRGRRYGYYYGPRYRYRGYGYRPGFRFYYGPRYHRRHWHYRYW